MPTPFPSWLSHGRLRGLLLIIPLLCLLAAAWHLGNRPQVTETGLATVASIATRPSPSGPPWRYGQASARFTVVFYGDLECPYCKSYYPIVKAWIDRHPEVSLQWHHLPLSMHEPAASRQAHLAECAGQAKGGAGFWTAIDWIYAQTRSDGLGIPETTRYPGLDPAVQSCLDERRADALVQAQASEGARDGVTATPTLKLVDGKSGTTLTLPGPTDVDALLSALDLLSAGGEASPAEHAEMPADAVGDMPR